MRPINRAGLTLLLLLSMLTLRAEAAGILFTVRESDDTLVRIDPDTLAFTDVGPLGTLFQFGGLAYDPFGDTLYMVGGRGNASLYTVNMTTGTATAVGEHGVTDLFGLAFDSTTGTLYGTQFAQGSSLYSLNTSTGSATLIGNTPGLGGLAYNSDADLLIGVQPGAGDLYSVDRSSGASSLLLNGPFADDAGLAYDPDRNLLWLIDWAGSLYSYDPNAGYSRTLRLSGLGPFDGLEYVVRPTVAEPASLLLVGAGGLSLLARARRRRSQQHQ